MVDSCRHILLVLLSLLAYMPAMSADTQTAIFNPRVRSLQVRESGAPYAMPGLPVMLLGSDAGITVDFDIIEETHRYLRYELVHCNADWQPSRLSYMEYVDGFNEGVVEDYRYSDPLTFHYVHYRIDLPDSRMRPLVSGNYLLRVFDEADGAEKPLLQVRFGVSEAQAQLAATVTGRTDVDYNASHQQLAVAADLERAGVRDPFNDLVLRIEQNGRTDNAVTLTHPLRVSSKKVFYEHDPRLIFPAGNEYRRFETVSVNYPGMGVDRYEFVSPYYHAVLAADESRAAEPYHYDETLAGSYVVRESNADDADIGADYVLTHFYLDYPETPGFDFFVDADFVQRRFAPESRMVFNRASGMYELTIPLKQGSYSYQYLALPAGSGATVGRTDVIEGDRYETRNRYRIYLYHRVPGERYDRLIAVTTLNSY